MNQGQANWDIRLVGSATVGSVHAKSARRDYKLKFPAEYSPYPPRSPSNSRPGDNIHVLRYLPERQEFLVRGTVSGRERTVAVLTLARHWRPVETALTGTTPPVGVDPATEARTFLANLEAAITDHAQAIRDLTTVIRDYKIEPFYEQVGDVVENAVKKVVG